MARVIQSPSKKYSGSITLPEFLTFPQLDAAETAFDEAHELGEVRFTKWRRAILPGLLACVERWDLENFPQPVTVENFPATPRVEVGEIINAVLGVVSALVSGAEVVPPK